MDGQRIRKLYQNICQKTQPECNGRCQRRRRGIQISVWYPQCDVRSRGIPRTEYGWQGWTRFELESYIPRSAGYFGRINYDYKGIYLLELNGRYDGSSRFPHTDQWAFFPSASIGYRFSEEAYFAPLKHIVSNGKLRASFGEIGNEAVGDYMFEQLISQRLNNKSTGYIYWIENNNANANLLTMYNMPDLVSSTLTWERIRTLNIGLDLGLLNDELTIGFDWFQRENRDMLAPAQVLPNTLGASAPMKVRRNLTYTWMGVELELAPYLRRLRRICQLQHR